MTYIIIFIGGFATGAIVLELLWYDRRRKVCTRTREFSTAQKSWEEPLIHPDPLPELGEGEYPNTITGQDQYGKLYTLDDNGHWIPDKKEAEQEGKCGKAAV